MLAGSEVDILADGSLDYEDEILQQLDWVVASPHSSLRQEPAKATERLLKAIEHPLVHVIGHPTGRLINEREGLSPDMATLIAAAREHDTALELNANPWRLDLRDKHVRLAATEEALVTIDTDAHRPADFDLLRFGVLTARRGGLTTNLCPNCWDSERLLVDQVERLSPTPARKSNMWIVGAIIQILICGVIFGFILQIAARIIIKEGIDFGDAVKTAIVATAAVMVGGLGLNALALDGTLMGVLDFGLPFVIWTLALLVVIGTTLVQSILIAFLFSAINWLITLVFGFMLALGATMGSLGS